MKGIEGLKEIRQALQSKDGVLWCMGKSEFRKRQCPIDEDSETELDTGTEKRKKKQNKRSKYEEKLDRIDDMLDQLKQKHKNTYTSI